MSKQINLENLSEINIDTLYDALRKDIENNGDTKLGKAFYALSRTKEKVNSIKTDYFGALKHLKMFWAVSNELILKDNCYAPILAKNIEIVRNLMFRSMKTENPVYKNMLKLSEMFMEKSEPEQLERALESDKYSFEYIGLRREFLSQEGKNRYAMEVNIL